MIILKRDSCVGTVLIILVFSADFKFTCEYIIYIVLYMHMQINFKVDVHALIYCKIKENPRPSGSP